MDTTPDPRRWWGLAAIGLAQLMVVLDMTIVNIAMPTMQVNRIPARSACHRTS